MKTTDTSRSSSDTEGQGDSQNVRFVETITSEQRDLEKALARDPQNSELRAALAAFAAENPDFYYRRDMPKSW